MGAIRVCVCFQLSQSTFSDLPIQLHSQIPWLSVCLYWWQLKKFRLALEKTFSFGSVVWHWTRLPGRMGNLRPRRYSGPGQKKPQLTCSYVANNSVLRGYLYKTFQRSFWPRFLIYWLCRDQSWLTLSFPPGKSCRGSAACSTCSILSTANAKPHLRALRWQQPSCQNAQERYCYQGPSLTSQHTHAI